MAVKKTSWLDVVFARRRWYRRLRGGRWYRVLDLPMSQGGFVIWTRTLLPGVPGKVLDFEDYGAGDFRYDLNVPKRDFEVPR